MKALVFDRYGTAEDVLELREVPEPSPGPGEVKVKLRYSPINPSDLANTIEGTYRDAVGQAIWNRGKCEDQFAIDPAGQRRLPEPPLTPGLEGVGEVVEAGKGLLPRMLKGKRVTIVGGRTGNWAEYAVADARQALPVRKGLSEEQAAVSFVNPVTAYAMIREVLRVQSGSTVLQSAGNSELGKMIIRLGRRFGFTTISIVRNPAQVDPLRALGADHVVDISSENLADRVAEITRGQGVPYALDPIAGSLADEMVHCLGLGGTLLVYGTLSGELVTVSSRDLMTPCAKIEGFFLTNWLGQCNLLKKLAVTRATASLVQSGELTSDIRKTFTLDEYRDAIAEVRKPGNQGKVLLGMG